MGWLLLFLLTVTAVVILGMHFGIWGSALQQFSDDSTRNVLKMTTRLTDYEIARYQKSSGEITLPRLAFVKETELFSQRQREILEDILIATRKRTVLLGIPLLCLIAWGSIFISHKIAGPLYHFNRIFGEMKAKNLTARIRLRKHDEGKQTAAAFNEAIAEIDRSIAKIKKAAEQGNRSGIPHEIFEELSKFKTSQG